MGRDTNPQYWKEFTNLQHTKHALIREYLNGWFPKLGLWSGRVVYLDTHAGRGEHTEGQSGSPVVALETLLKHTFRDRILEKSEVRFRFIEFDPQNIEYLTKKVSALGSLPDRIRVTITADDCYSQIKALLEHLESSGKRIAPAFVFVDPYGFKVPGALLAQLVAAGRVELFVNVIWRELDMAVAQAQASLDSVMSSTLDSIFNGDRWRQIDRNASVDTRADQAID
ncbi:MAG TPA: three-Cys-motif partner protein TcmP, partial [Candidatus Binatia bacterium]|nr:three-Cys-motif partner protein TcmP [Candidatus Binatia bacterium]